MTRDDSWNYADVLWNGIQAKAVTAAFEQLSYKEQWYLEKRNAICMTCRNGVKAWLLTKAKQFFPAKAA